LFSFVLHSFRTKKEGKFCHLFNKKLKDALCFLTIAGLVVGTLVSVWLIWSVIAAAPVGWAFFAAADAAPLCAPTRGAMPVATMM
jgi:hypothetical protein